MIKSFWGESENPRGHDPLTKRVFQFSKLFKHIALAESPRFPFVGGGEFSGIKSL